MTRWKAAGLHLAISAVVGALALALLLFVWYPPPYFLAAGAGRLATILLGVDVVVGPLLTLLVYRAGKRGLRMDLTIIALLQSAALVYGLHVMWASRPVYLVASVDRFVLVTANMISDEALAEAPPKYADLPCCGPRLVGAVLPFDPKEREAITMSALGGGPDVDSMPRHYRDYHVVAAQLLERAKTLADLIQENPYAAKAAENVLDENAPQSGVVWVPIATRGEHLTMLLDARTGEPLGAINVDPW